MDAVVVTNFVATKKIDFTMQQIIVVVAMTMGIVNS